MLLTSRQVAEKLGTTRNHVTAMAKKGILPSVPPKHQTPSGRVNYGFDPKVVREFQQTFLPPTPKAAPKVKVSGNGHAPTTEMDVLRLTLGRIEEKLDQLMAVWQ